MNAILFKRAQAEVRSNRRIARAVDLAAYYVRHSGYTPTTAVGAVGTRLRLTPQEAAAVQRRLSA